MRVLFISANTERNPVIPLPLGPAFVASACRRAGHETSLLNLMFEEDTGEAIRIRIRDFRPDLVAVSVRNIDDQNMAEPRWLLGAARDVVTDCRNESSAPIVVGGAAYSVVPESALRYLGADIGIRGEGESIFPALLDCLAAGAEVAELPGVYLPGRPSRRRAFAPALDDVALPEPEFLIPPNGPVAGLSVPVQGKRGCPMGCSYCTTRTLEGKCMRRRSAHQLVAWMEQFVSRGYRDFAFVDNTFNLPPSYAKEVCRGIIDRRLDANLWCIIYPNWVDQELVDLMARAGCREISLGFESGSEGVLKGFHKRFRQQEVRRIARMFRQAGIAQRGFLLLGGPDETVDSARESFAFADSLELDSLDVTVGIRIYPETDLARIAVENRMIAPDDDLLQPTFYLTPALRDWLPDAAAEYTASRTAPQPT